MTSPLHPYRRIAGGTSWHATGRDGMYTAFAAEVAEPDQVETGT